VAEQTRGGTLPDGCDWARDDRRSVGTRAIRTRWAAIGAALAVIAGVGGVSASGAINSSVTPQVTSITPCRIMDTRPAPRTVGPRSTPLQANTTHTIQVTGVNGGCRIPGDATSVFVNVTVVSPAATGFLTVFPAGAARPATSVLNFATGQPSLSNFASAALSSTGGLSFFVSGGPVDLIADISGFTTGARLSGDELTQLRWDLDRSRTKSANVGSSPTAVAFDGTNVWVANFNSKSVSRINAVTGEKVLPDITVGTGPTALAFDGTRMWVANRTAGTLTRIDVATGQVLPAIVPGSQPRGLAFDGTRMWVSSVGSDDVRAFDAATGALIGTETYPAGSDPVGIAYSGGQIWTALQSSNVVARIGTDPPFVVSLESAATGLGPSAVAFDGVNIWVANQGQNSVSRYRRDGVKITPDIAVGDNPIGLAFDGSNMWVANQNSNVVSRIDTTTSVKLPDIAVTAGAGGIVFDGANMWLSFPSQNRVVSLRAT
jgi:YVTN family beta-propeller protein